MPRAASASSRTIVSPIACFQVSEIFIQILTRLLSMFAWCDFYYNGATYAYWSMNISSLTTTLFDKWTWGVCT